MRELKIIDKRTGEAIDLESIDGKAISKEIAAMSKQEIDNNFARYSLIEKFAKKINSLIKTRIKNEVKDGLDAGDTVMYEHIPVKNISSVRFDEKALLEAGDPDDIMNWMDLKARYSRPTSSIRIG